MHADSRENPHGPSEEPKPVKARALAAAQALSDVALFLGHLPARLWGARSHAEEIAPEREFYD